MASLQEVRVELSKELEKLKAPTNLLRRMAAQAYSDSLDRIFTQGRKSDGSQLGTYAEATEKAKVKKGRFTSSTINLRDTEDLVNSYKFEQDTPGRFVLGFEEIGREGINNSRLVDVLEDKYGDVFSLTEEENNRLDIIVDNFLNDLF